jgi:SAM-dependent methyltransferase
MCHLSCINFVASALIEQEIKGKLVLEVGSLDVNGSIRPHVEKLRPVKYIGVDVAMGTGVDEICNVKDILTRYGKESFDALITTELLEHVKDWKKAINNFKEVLKPGGILLITTRSIGFGYHGFPYDYWRFEEKDMKYIFSDFIVERLEKDPMTPGVFLKARKPARLSLADISNYALYSIILRRKTGNADNMFMRICNAGIQISIAVIPASLKTIIAKAFNKR